MRYICSITKGRYLKEIDNKSIIQCRVPDYNFSKTNYLKEKAGIYLEDIYKILEELTLAKQIELTQYEIYFDIDFKSYQTHKSSADEKSKARR